MGCKGFFEWLLKLLNLLLTLAGLAMVGYGIYLFIEFKNGSSDDDSGGVALSSGELIHLGRPMLMAMSLGNSFFDNLPKPWFIYLFIGIGAVLFVISCFGCIGTATRNGCCLTCYAALVILLILAQLGLAGFIFFDKNWRKEIPTDETGVFRMIYKFLDKYWKIARWVILGAVVFEALIFFLALVVRAANRPADYDSDDEYIGGPRQQIRHPLINRPPGTVTGVPVAAALDSRPSRNDAWSARMREKYGLDISEFTYNPSDSNRYQQATTQASEERKRCTIM